MSFKASSQSLSRRASSTTPIRMMKSSPAKFRKLESVMRGMSQHGITQIGFGNNAPTVDVNDLYPMEISKSVPEEKDIDEYTMQSVTTKTPKSKKAVKSRRRSSSQFLSDSNSKDSISGRKRRGNEVPLRQFIATPNKRHCHNDKENNNMMMVCDDINSPCSVSVSVLNEEYESLQNEYAHISKQNNSLNIENSELKRKMSEIQISLDKQIELSQEYEIEKERNDKACNSLKCLLNEVAISERQERETKLMEDNKLIGRVVQCHSNQFGQVSDIWEDGQLFEDLKRRRKILEMEREEIEIKKKELRKLKNKRKGSLNNKNSDFMVPSSKKMNELSLESEIISIRSALLKKQCNELEVEYCTLEYRKKIHIKFIRLMRDEKKSRFSINKNNRNKCYVLNDRYVLTNLLGRGGFSEVHRGYDLFEHKYIAAKIHQLNSHWSDERKKNYTKHATREYDIHKSLHHENIVSLYDVFGIDVNSFCTVLEYVDGMDLDMYLKINKTLQEREARSFMIQVFNGLKYLHNQSNPGPIIHYDLKPGNLLYKNGRIKLTDFGLAKIMERESESIELTSQGAGTYWYLPPECFKTGNQVYISPKVDIWSAGVIFFQMLFGKRPFGDDLSQDTILNNKTILNARHVTFPTQPKNVSKQAKDFIIQLCAYDPTIRLSSTQIVDTHPYFAYLRK